MRVTRSVSPQCGQNGPLGQIRASNDARAASSSWKIGLLRWGMVEDISALVTYQGFKELDERRARSPWLGDAICRSLGLGLLTEGVRAAGRAAFQLRLGRLCVLVV